MRGFCYTECTCLSLGLLDLQGLLSEFAEVLIIHHHLSVVVPCSITLDGEKKRDLALVVFNNMLEFASELKYF